MLQCYYVTKLLDYYVTMLLCYRAVVGETRSFLSSAEFICTIRDVACCIVMLCYDANITLGSSEGFFLLSLSVGVF